MSDWTLIFNVATGVAIHNILFMLLNALHDWIVGL